MRSANRIVSVLFVTALVTEPALAQQSAPAIAPGSVIRLRHLSLAPCANSGTVVALRRDSAVVALPLAGAAVGSSTVECGVFMHHVVDVAELDVWRGPSRGGRRGAWRGLIVGPVAGALIGMASASNDPRSDDSFAAMAGGVLGLLVGPVVGGLIGVLTSPDEWTPAATASGSR